MIGIVNYGAGNLLSVFNVIDFIGEEVEICNKPEELIKIKLCYQVLVLSKNVCQI